MKKHSMTRICAGLYAVSIYASLILLIYLFAYSQKYDYKIAVAAVAPLVLSILFRFILSHGGNGGQTSPSGQVSCDSPGGSEAKRGEMLDAVLLVKGLTAPLNAGALAGIILLLWSILDNTMAMFIFAMTGIVAIIVLSVIYISGAALFTIPYIWRARQDGLVGTVGTVFFVISQFLLFFGTFSVIVMAWRERRHRIAATIVLVIYGLIIAGAMRWGSANL